MLRNSQWQLRSAVHLPRFLTCPACGFLVCPWPSLMGTDLSGDPCTGLTLVTRPDLFTSLADCGSVSRHWQGLFNAYLIHLPFGIIHNAFKFYNYLLFKLHYFSLEVGSNIDFQPSPFFSSFPAGFFIKQMWWKSMFWLLFSLFKKILAGLDKFVLLTHGPGHVFTAFSLLSHASYKYLAQAYFQNSKLFTLSLFLILLNSKDQCWLLQIKHLQQELTVQGKDKKEAKAPKSRERRRYNCFILNAYTNCDLQFIVHEGENVLLLLP